MVHLGHWPPDPIDSVLLDPSLFMSPRSVEALSVGIGRKVEGLKVLIPSEFVAALQEAQSFERLLPFWTFWGGRRTGPSLKSVTGVVNNLLATDQLVPYQHRIDTEERGLLDSFRAALPRGRARDPLTARILFEELDYLRSHSTVLGRSRRMYDALVAAGSIVVQFGEQHVPPDVLAKLKRLGWKRIVTKVGIGLGISIPGFVFDPAWVFVAGPLNTVIGLLDP